MNLSTMYILVVAIQCLAYYSYGSSFSLVVFAETHMLSGKFIEYIRVNSSIGLYVIKHKFYFDICNKYIEIVEIIF